MGDNMIKSENLLQELFEDSGAIVLITDGDYNIRYCSSSIQHVLGFRPISIIGKNAFEFAPSSIRDQWKDCLDQVGTSAKTEIQLKSTWGEEKYFDVTVANRIASHEIHGLVIMLHDITSRKNETIELARKKDHLDQFIFKTTHDLRSPIHSAMGLLNLLEKANEEQRGIYLQMTRNTLLKLESLIEEVNHLYKVDRMAVKKEKVDLKKLLEEEIEVLKNHPLAGNIHFEIEFAEEAELFSDELRVRTILGNILSNAVKYSDSKKSKSYIAINARVEEEHLKVSISDNGIGIAKESIDHIFDIFYRATSEGEGTGLGLHIVKDTITRLHGMINVQSELGEGTRFEVSIPNLIFSAPEDVLSEDEKKAIH